MDKKLLENSISAQMLENRTGENEDVTTDVVVVGSGFAGLSAAIAAALAGASVIVLEKRETCGGNSLVSGGTLTVAGSSIQAREGIEDSLELMEQDMLAAGKGLNDHALVKCVARESYPTLQWLTNEIGVRFQDRVDQFGGHSLPRNHTPDNASGAEIIEPLLVKAKELGVEIKTRMALCKLLTDAKVAVVGVEARDRTGCIQKFWANRGVVLATGGFAGDVEFRMLHNPQLTEAIDHTNQPETSAEALTAAIELGAQCLHMNEIQLAPWVSPDEKGYGVAPLLASYTVLAYGVAINPTTGKRFINELADRKLWTDTLFRIGHPCIGIADRAGVQNSGMEVEPYVGQGVIAKFEDLESLASAYLIPQAALHQTIERYNHYVARHRDEEFNKPLRERSKPLSPPYYSVRLWPKVHYTMGGLKIDTKARVIDRSDRPIARLYAAGEVTGGIHGACRLGGCAISECLIFGRIAGQNAAANISIS